VGRKQRIFIHSDEDKKKNKSMIKILLKRGFFIKDKIPMENLLETQIIMGKQLG